MTLDTRVYIIGEVDPMEVFAFCNTLLKAPESVKTTTKQTGRWNKGQEIIESTDPWITFNHPAQGLPALMDVRYRKDGPLRTLEQHRAHEEFCNVPGNDYYNADTDLCDGEHVSRPACWMEVSFDTAYSYRGPRDEGCGELHERLLRELGEWLAAAGLAWKWRNEFTGEVWDGFGNLKDLVRGSGSARLWFNTEALPAIKAHIEAEGRAMTDPVSDLGIEAVAEVTA